MTNPSKPTLEKLFRLDNRLREIQDSDTRYKLLMVGAKLSRDIGRADRQQAYLKQARKLRTPPDARKPFGFFLLPLELKILVVRSLDMRSLLRMRACSQATVQLFDNSPELWNIEAGDSLKALKDDSFIWYWQRVHRNLKCLKLLGVKQLSGQALAKVSPKPNVLQELQISKNQRITGSAIVTFLSDSSLLHTMARLSFTNMNHLDNNSLAKVLNFFENLKYLDVSYCGSITDAAFTIPPQNRSVYGSNYRN